MHTNIHYVFVTNSEIKVNIKRAQTKNSCSYRCCLCIYDSPQENRLCILGEFCCCFVNCFSLKPHILSLLPFLILTCANGVPATSLDDGCYTARLCGQASQRSWRRAAACSEQKHSSGYQKRCLVSDSVFFNSLLLWKPLV